MFKKPVQYKTHSESNMSKTICSPRPVDVVMFQVESPQKSLLGLKAGSFTGTWKKLHEIPSDLAGQWPVLGQEVSSGKERSLVQGQMSCLAKRDETTHIFF